MGSLPRGQRLLPALLALALAACDPGAETEPDPAETGAADTDAEVAPGVPAAFADRGEELWEGGVCTVCHASDAGGTQLGPSLRDGEWNRIDGDMEGLVRVIRDGLADPGEYPVPMPPLGGGDFDEDDVRALAAFLYRLNRPDRP